MEPTINLAELFTNFANLRKALVKADGEVTDVEATMEALMEEAGTVRHKAKDADSARRAEAIDRMMHHLEVAHGLFGNIQDELGEVHDIFDEFGSSS